MKHTTCTKCKQQFKDLFRHGGDVLCKQCFIDKPKRPPGRPLNKVKNATVVLRVPEKAAEWVNDNKEEAVKNLTLYAETKIKNKNMINNFRDRIKSKDKKD